MSTLEEIDSLLNGLESEIPGVVGTIVATQDGFVITDTLSGDGAEEVAAMVATTAGVSARMSDTLSAGTVEETSIKGEKGSIFLYRSGEEGVLGVVAEGDVNVGMINLRARKVAREVEERLQSPSVT
jgi:hypothetical protein